MTQLRVCLEARIDEGNAGGIQQFVMGLAKGLSSLVDGDEEYLFLTRGHSVEWLRPLLAGPCREVPAPEGHEAGKASPRRWPLPRPLRRRILDGPLGSLVPTKVPTTDGAAECTGAQVMHFTVQSAFLTKLPSVYQPYDLQHLHFPRFFSAYSRRSREAQYRAFSAQASAVVVMSSWVRDDILREYGLPTDKVHVIPWAPVVGRNDRPRPEEVAATRARLHLPETFAFYPAQTWPHKNHIRLLEAVASLRDRRGLRIPLVCSGAQNAHFRAIRRRRSDLGLNDQVAFVGYVSTLEVRCLYEMARVVVFPSLFEGGGMPIFEAFAAGVPVACASVTGLPRQVGDAALLFEPTSVEDMSWALERLWMQPELRALLAQRGERRVEAFSWERTAKKYRAIYRKAAGHPLGDEDRALLLEEPLT